MRDAQPRPNDGAFEQLAENVWLLSYPLKLLGADMRRNVTILRLENSQLLIHSTGPFTDRDQARIRELAQPALRLVRHEIEQIDLLGHG